MDRHAFLIMAHNEPEVLATLLRQTDADGFDVYLHIDTKARELQQRFAHYAPHHGRFFLLPHPLDIRWGDISQVDAEMLLLRTAAANGPYAYYHILSGTDLLLKSPEALREAFAAHPEQEYVNYWSSPSHLRDLRRKTSRYYLFTQHIKDKGSPTHAALSLVRNVVLATQKITRFRRSTPKGIEFRKGGNWASITEAFAQYLLQHEPRFRSRLKYTLCPDEIYKQTLLWSSPLQSHAHDAHSEEAEPSTLRKIDWMRGSPYTWQSQDYEELTSSTAVFARKFSSQYIDLVQRIEQHTCTRKDND